MQPRTSLIVAFLVACPSAAHAQQQAGGFETFHLTAWVDPLGGVDGASNHAQEQQINDPDNPFKTLQTAIDAMSRELVDVYVDGELGDIVQGTIYALPGVYGPTTPGTPNASGDSLPIVLRDRIHVQGFGAARCFIRGSGTPNAAVSWPDGTIGYYAPVEILLDLGKTSHSAPLPGASGPPQWWQEYDLEADTVEVFDGFTFQGGDVQVFMHSGVNSASPFLAPPFLNHAVVSNCVFDMRHGWSVQGSVVSGPTFGVMMVNRFVSCDFSGPFGYVDTRLLVANCTFVMAQYGVTGWINGAKNDAVGIINVNDPACNDASGNFDCDLTSRGMASPGIINNVFRTRPGSNQMAMLGISAMDTEVMDQSTSVQTNAFSGIRVGSQSPNYPTSGFVSVPVSTGIVWPYTGLQTACVVGDMINCGGASTGGFSAVGCPSSNCVTSVCTVEASPTPQVEIYDGVSGTGADPAFVGEYLVREFSSQFNEDYADWRILPGDQDQPHPFQDKGFVPHGNTLTMTNGTVFKLPTHPRAPSPFRWDGEYYAGLSRVFGRAA